MEILRGKCAGQSYPADEAGVLDMVRAQFEKAGGLPVNGAVGRGGPLPGLVVPHLDFRVSGDVYAHGYRAFLEAEAPEVVVILGVGHRGRVELSADGRDYETVLGRAVVDQPLLAALRERSPVPLDADPAAHVGEHSIEFTLLYLQALARLVPDRPAPTFVPVLCGGMFEEMQRGTTDGSAYHGFADALREVIEGSGRRVCVIGSVDGSHVGSRFQHPDKVDRKLLKQIAALDSLAWHLASEGDTDTFFKMFLSNRNAQNFDGVGVLYLMMRLFAGRAKAGVLKYAQWFEPSDASVVTLASAAFRPVTGA